MRATWHWVIVQKYDFGHGRGISREMDFIVNTNDFAVINTHTSVVVNSNLYDMAAMW